MVILINWFYNKAGGLSHLSSQSDIIRNTKQVHNDKSTKAFSTHSSQVTEFDNIIKMSVAQTHVRLLEINSLDLFWQILLWW